MPAMESVTESLSPRPGDPKEAPPPVAVPDAPLGQQAPTHTVFTATGRPLTPVFGTSVPPRGLSGLLRRQAYALPDHDPLHWQILLLADRVDVWEHRLLDGAREHPILAALGIATSLLLVARALTPAAATPQRQALIRLVRAFAR
jgi:hypothetical protein